jgi:hypothetical protein
MISNIQRVKKARELRLSGKSYSEIKKELNVSLGTVFNWVGDIVLNTEQVIALKNRITPKISRGRLNASIIRRSSRVFKERKIYNEAEREFERLIKDHFFVFGLSLYLAKRSKNGGYFHFINPNSEIVALMNKWVIKFLKVETNLIKKVQYSNYSGILITRIDVVRKILAWQKLIIKYYSDK